MLTFKDRTFCINPKCTCPEEYRLTEEVEAAAHKWWEGVHPGHGREAPIAIGDRCNAKPSTLAAAVQGLADDFADIAAGYKPGTRPTKKGDKYDA